MIPARYWKHGTAHGIGEEKYAEVVAAKILTYGGGVEWPKTMPPPGSKISADTDRAGRNAPVRNVES